MKYFLPLLLALFLTANATPSDTTPTFRLTDTMTEGVPGTGLLGHPVITVDMGAAHAGGIREEDENMRDAGQAGLTLNLPLADHVDLGTSVWFLRLDEDEEEDNESLELNRLTGEAMIHLSLRPGTRFNPYISGGYFLTRTTQTEQGLSQTDSDGGFSYGGGLELQVNRQTGLLLSALQVEQEDGSALMARATLQFWFVPTIAARIGATHLEEPETNSVFIGILLNL